MAQLDPHDYVMMGRRAIVELLDTEAAAVWMEIEAKIADTRWPSLMHRVEPHHLTAAKTDLLARAAIQELEARSRGGRTISVIATTSPRRGTAISRAAQRKRLLMARYLGWAQGTPSRPGVIGPAAERAAHSSLMAAAAYGYRLLQPDGSGVALMLGTTLPGPLDDGAIFTAMNEDGSAGRSVAIPIEVKNVRDWLYPNSQELYQLLDKATTIQSGRTGLAVMPVLVCRRAHYTLFRMAKDLGFFVVETRRQFILPTVQEEDVLDLRRELGFLDLVRGDGADDRITRRLTHTLPTYAVDRAERWAATAASEASAQFSPLRSLAHAHQRSAQMEVLRALCGRDLDIAGGW